MKGMKKRKLAGSVLEYHQNFKKQRLSDLESFYMSEVVSVLDRMSNKFDFGHCGDLDRHDQWLYNPVGRFLPANASVRSIRQPEYEFIRLIRTYQTRNDDKRYDTPLWSWKPITYWESTIGNQRGFAVTLKPKTYHVITWADEPRPGCMFVSQAYHRRAPLDHFEKLRHFEFDDLSDYKDRKQITWDAVIRRISSDWLIEQMEQCCNKFNTLTDRNVFTMILEFYYDQ